MEGSSASSATRRCRQQWALWLTTSMVILAAAEGQSPSPMSVRLEIQDTHVVIDNGILNLTLSNPGGIVTGVQYNGVDNLLEIRSKEDRRGYWDLVWNNRREMGHFDIVKGTTFRVIQEDEDKVEVSFVRTWNSNLTDIQVPLNIDKRFVVLKGCSGFYSYAIYEHLEGWPAFELSQTRIVIKLRRDKFYYMVADDTRQHVMPSPEDRLMPRGQPLAFKEAVLLVEPINGIDEGRVDDKYQYSLNNKDSKVHGWISSNPAVGFWQIMPSYEFRSGGPMKQELTSHVGPATLSVFQSAHYSGDDLEPKFDDGEPWKKVYGPVFFYLNSAQAGDGIPSLWEDAKIQMAAEVTKWPYSFPASVDFPPASQRGAVQGRLLVTDVDDLNGGLAVPASGAYVGLAAPGDVGSWQRECKGYQFWTEADTNGNFSITNVRSGSYHLFAWVPGILGDYMYGASLNIAPGSSIRVGDLEFTPLRDGPTLWEIGVPDRTAMEFYVPDPSPEYYNEFLSAPQDRFRQYGLWERYADLYPTSDLVYTVGVSNYSTDWFYAHVTRKVGNNTYEPTTWQIRFNMDAVLPGTYKLRVSIASAQLAQLRVHLNTMEYYPLFSSGGIGRDNSIARHGIHGLHWMYNIDIPSTRLVPGLNTLFFTQPRGQSPFQALLYDYIRLEGPPV